jgi:ketosteroid isomerase-like protein
MKKIKMKKTIPVMLAAAFMILTALVNPAKAQHHKREMINLAKQYQEAYNRKDFKTLKEFYTKDAVEINIDGTSIKGNEAIMASMSDVFKEGRVNEKIKIIPDKSITNSDGSVTTTGTYYIYHVTDTSAKDEKIDGGGYFTNTIVKENGHWKISKSVLSKG